MKNSDKYFSASGGDSSTRLGIAGIVFFVIGVIITFSSVAGIILIFTGIYLFMVNEYIEINAKTMHIRRMNYFPPFKFGTWVKINKDDQLSLTYSKESSPSYYVGAFYRQRRVQNAWFDVYLIRKDDDKNILLFTSETYSKSLEKMELFKHLLKLDATDHIKNHRKNRIK